jgi:pimeloyl-ACP methyl ester carboxylesterase
MTVDQEPLRQALARISAPTLSLWGTADRVIPHALIDDLVAAHPDWAFEPIDGIGHFLPWEAPDQIRDRTAAPRSRRDPVRAQNRA